jgi:hypothetical protein
MWSGFTRELAALGCGKAAGEEWDPEVDAEVLYYMQLAQSYLPVRCAHGAQWGAEPYNHAPGKRASRSTISTSGRALANYYPAHANLETSQGLVFGRREGTPDCLSCSIPRAVYPNPRLNSRSRAGRCRAAEAYLRHQRSGGYNFSDALMGRKLLPFTTDAGDLREPLCVPWWWHRCVRVT